jgi:hypothetical protein
MTLKLGRAQLVGQKYNYHYPDSDKPFAWEPRD